MTLLVLAAQPALLIVTRETAATPDGGWLFAAAVHVGVLFVLLLPGTAYIARLMYETVQVSAAGAFAFTFAAATGALGSAAVLLVGIPAMFASVAARIGGGGG